MKTPRFLADHMNGDLAKWLRIMGFDCAYPERELDDKNIVDLCLKEERILLTKDKGLHSYALRRGVKSILIIGNTTLDKFKSIYDEINLNRYYNYLTPRCTICNGELIKVNPKSIKTLIHEDIKKKYTEVYYCNKCGKVYWEGSHWRGIKKTVSKIISLGNIKNDKYM